MPGPGLCDPQAHPTFPQAIRPLDPYTPATLGLPSNPNPNNISSSAPLEGLALTVPSPWDTSSKPFSPRLVVPDLEETTV